MGNQWKQCQTLFIWAPKSLQMMTAAMNLKDVIFLTQELNWGLLHCRRILYQLSYQGSPITSVIEC